MFAPSDLINDYSSQNSFQKATKAPSLHLRKAFTNDVRFAIGQLNRLIGLLKLYYYSIPLSTYDLKKMQILYGAYEEAIGELVTRSARRKIRVGKAADLKTWAQRKHIRGRPPEGRWKTVSFSTTRSRREQLKESAGALSLNKWVVQTVLSREIPLLVNLEALNKLNEIGRKLKAYYQIAKVNHAKERALRVVQRKDPSRTMEFNPTLVENFESQIQHLQNLVYPERRLLSLSDMIENRIRFQADDFSDLYEDFLPKAAKKRSLK